MPWVARSQQWLGRVEGAKFLGAVDSIDLEGSVLSPYRLY